MADPPIQLIDGPSYIASLYETALPGTPIRQNTIVMEFNGYDNITKRILTARNFSIIGGTRKIDSDHIMAMVLTDPGLKPFHYLLLAAGQLEINQDCFDDPGMMKQTERKFNDYLSKAIRLKPEFELAQLTDRYTIAHIPHTPFFFQLPPAERYANEN